VLAQQYRRFATPAYREPLARLVVESDTARMSAVFE
jgi:hypothetical protein